MFHIYFLYQCTDPVSVYLSDLTLACEHFSLPWHFNVPYTPFLLKNKLYIVQDQYLDSKNNTY